MKHKTKCFELERKSFPMTTDKDWAMRKLEQEVSLKLTELMKANFTVSAVPGIIPVQRSRGYGGTRVRKTHGFHRNNAMCAFVASP